MKVRNIIVILLATIIFFFAIWTIFFRSSTPTNEPGAPVSTEAPFGTPEASIPGLPSDFEGTLAPIPESTNPSGSTEQEVAQLLRVESSPVAGFTLLSKGSTTIVRYAERGTGNIFDVALGSTLNKTRLTNETLPQIYEAYFRADGGAALFRGLDEFGSVKNMALALTAPKASSTDAFYKVAMTLLRGTIDSVSVGVGDVLSYVLPDSNMIASSKFNGDAVKTLLSNDFTSWRTARFGNNLLIFTKPSATIPGYAYTLSQGTLTHLVGPLNGLVAIANPAASSILYSYTDSSAHLVARDMKENEVELSPSTIADKCVGSAKQKTLFYCGAPASGISRSEPDLWYQGKSHFTDGIWSFDSITGSANLIVDPEERFGAMLDLSLPALSADEKYLVFVNKRDLSLWALMLR